jgi:hypothetical protein
VTQRMQTWLIAQECKRELHAKPSDSIRAVIAKAAIGHGFFSVWMTVFEDHPAVRKKLIQAFSGTAADCFDPKTTLPASPRPGNGLTNGGKV